MRITRKRLRRLGTVAAATAMTTVVGLSTLAPPASAWPTSPDKNQAIENKNHNIRDTENALWQANFQYYNDVDGQLGADTAPDGQGAFQWYTGNGGQGAIYLHDKWGGTRYVQKIYGNILVSWSSLGWETGKGYPESDEQNATSYDVQRGCPQGTWRVQVFSKLTDAGTRRACWSPNFAAPYGVYWTS
jgi:hypothetical protein